MRLSETTFDEFINWCEDNKKHWHTERQYVTVPKLKVIYDYYVKNNMECKGNRCTITVNNEWDSNFTEPLDYEPAREDFVWNMFHEVWCKTEWAVRCMNPSALGYTSVKDTIGSKTLKALKEVA